MQTLPPPDGHHWVFWDGECDFCRRAIHWLHRQDRQHRLRTSPYQDAPAVLMTPELSRRCRDAVQLLFPDGRVAAGGRAMLEMLRVAGWRPRLVRLLLRPPLIFIVDIGYRIVAANRPFFSRLFFRLGSDEAGA